MSAFSIAIFAVNLEVNCLGFFGPVNSGEKEADDEAQHRGPHPRRRGESEARGRRQGLGQERAASDKSESED